MKYKTVGYQFHRQHNKTVINSQGYFRLNHQILHKSQFSNTWLRITCYIDNYIPVIGFLSKIF
jgi:hypothetical protein